MYLRALAGREKALGPEHTLTLLTVNNLGILYRDQGKTKKAEKMLQRTVFTGRNTIREHLLVLNQLRFVRCGGCERGVLEVP